MDVSQVIDDRAVMRKVFWRIMPLPLILGIVSIIDRTNIGYAALEMNKELGFSEAAFGFGAGILFFGYFVLEVPSNAALARFGAPKWLTRIAVSWGIITILTAFVWNEWSFYLARFLLGLAEAGLFPGIVLYLTYWFPRRYRAKATGIFMASVPLSVVIGGPLSGWLLTQNGLLGLRGWQLIFVFQGIPAIIFGLVIWFAMKDQPKSVSWLSPPEKRWLTETLASEAKDAKQPDGRLIDGFKNRYVWAFTVMYFCFACGSYGVGFFLPQIIKQFGVANQTVGWLSAIPYALAVVAMFVVAYHSDRTGERRLHFAVPMIVGGLGLLGAGLTLSIPVLALIFIIAAVCGLESALANFWPRPTSLIAGTVAVAGIAVINSFGNIGGFVGPYIFGLLTDLGGGSFIPGLVFLTIILIVGGLLSLVVRRNARDKHQESKTPSLPAASIPHNARN